MALVEVRLLGGFRVRRVDGTYVDAQDWRTAMTRGVLALVALRAPNPVPVDQVLEMIWPDADPARSRARLRTAASQIRKVVGTNCIQREGDALVLREAWVDTEGFKAAVAQVRRHLILGDVDAGLTVARDAMALYAGDVCEDWPYTDWIDGTRAHLSELHQRLLEEIAEAALGKGLHVEAVRLAERAAQVDVCSERACRVLMQANQALGETADALMAYERCRSALVDTLGADPSDQTESIHRSLLRRSDATPPVPFIGRGDLLGWLSETASHAFASAQASLVHLVGPPGSGKSRLLDELSLRIQADVILVRLQSLQGKQDGSAYAEIMRRAMHQVGEESPARLAVDQPTLICIDDAQWADRASMQRLQEQVSQLQAPLLVVVAGADPSMSSAAGDRGRRLGALSLAEVTEVAGAVCERPVSTLAVESLMDYSGGLPGPLIEEALRWRAAGLTAEDAQGNRRADRPTEAPEQPERLLEAARERLSPAGLEVMELLTVLAGSFEIGDLQQLVHVPDAVQEALDVLLDAGVVDRNGAMWSISNSQMGEAAYGWLRPSVRRELHGRIAAADGVRLSRDSRLRHWLAAGVPSRAIDNARRSSADRGASRVEDKLAQLAAEGKEPTAWYQAFRESVSEVDLAERIRVKVLGGRVLSHSSVPAAGDALTKAVQLADEMADPRLQVEVRGHLAAVLLAGRDFEQAEKVGKAAAAIADVSGAATERTRSLRMLGLTALWGGQPQSALHLLQRAWGTAEAGSALQADVTRWLARVLNALGDPGVEEALEFARRLADERAMGGWRLVAAEVALEEGSVDVAHQHLREVPRGTERLTAMERVWLALLVGRVCVAAGRPAAAERALNEAVQLGFATGALLPVAEAAARLAAIQGPNDTSAARRSLQTAHRIIDGRPNPREQSIVLMSQSRVLRCEGEHEGALGLAKAASRIAQQVGLVRRVEEAQAAIADCPQSRTSRTDAA